MNISFIFIGSHLDQTETGEIPISVDGNGTFTPRRYSDHDRHVSGDQIPFV